MTCNHTGPCSCNQNPILDIVEVPLVETTTIDFGGVQAGPLEIAFTFTQNIPSDTWVINHNLGFKPNVTVQDSAGTIVEGEITYTDSNNITLTFTSAFSGYAYLS